MDFILFMANTTVFQDISFNGLKPQPVWKHFATLCKTPRQSKHEAQIRNTLHQWAEEQGLVNFVDKGGNLIIRKPASTGRENASGIILQAHLDMVCQKNDSISHNFSTDPICAIIRDNLVLAENTTLGADDGIGVALILSILEDKTLEHGPIEALLTVDEEEGMGGANKLATDLLRGRLLINLDSETWGDFCLGCAGGMDITVERPGHPADFPTGWQAVKIDITGLCGGHSGINIHEGRGNAIKILTRILCFFEKRFPLCLSSFTGGTARNALPREASAIIGIQSQNMASVNGLLQQWQILIKKELADIDEGIKISWSPTTTDRIMSAIDQKDWLRVLHASPHGVYRMSISDPSSPETSNNLGTVNLQPETSSCVLMVRSTVDSACKALAEEIVSLFSLAGLTAKQENAYPGWTPNLHSPLLALCRKIYQKEFASEPATHVIHAGLECGILKFKYPDMDIISFGPTIHSPHAPGESIEIDTVGKSWQLLKAILSNVS